jgi:hypothetical protein
MRAKLLVSEFAYPTTATTSNSTPILLTAANVGSVYGGQAAVPGEDMGFPSSGSAVVAVELEGVTCAAADVINIQASTNYYADSGAGETFVTTGTTGALSALTTKSKTIFVDALSLGEAVRISITTNGVTGVGTVSAYLLSN